MNINQAFEILKKSGGIRAARIITNGKKTMPWWRVLWAAWQLRRDMPVAKIIHEKWFYGLPFYTNKHTLDPRPDTETLVEAVLNIKHKTLNILDLGTGTGNIICALIKNIPNATGVGIDKSHRAIRVAKKNVKNLNLDDRIKIIHADFHHPSSFILHPFDTIVSNPPYIARGDTRVDTGAMHDPAGALYAGNRGLSAYESIAKNAPAWLKPGGNMFLEIGDGMGADVRIVFQSHGWQFIKSWNDLSGIERVLSFTFYK